MATANRGGRGADTTGEAAAAWGPPGVDDDEDATCETQGGSPWERMLEALDVEPDNPPRRNVRRRR